jgi:hypothetical protein
MSVELHRPPKPEESQKNLKFFNGKNHTLPGIRTHHTLPHTLPRVDSTRTAVGFVCRSACRFDQHASVSNQHACVLIRHACVLIRHACVLIESTRLRVDRIDTLAC